MSKLLFLLVLNFVAAAVENNGESQSQTDTPSVSSTQKIPNSSQTTPTPLTQEGQDPLDNSEPGEGYLLSDYDAELLEGHSQIQVLMEARVGNRRICERVTFIIVNSNDDNCGCAYHTAKRDVKHCNMNVKPIVRKLTETDSDSDVSCGPKEKEGSLFSFGYKACEINAHSEKTSLPLLQEESADFFEVYKFCHSKKDNEVIYTEHTIRDSKFLILPALKIQQKQDKEYNMITDGFEYFGSYYEDIAGEYKKLNTLLKWKNDNTFSNRDIASSSIPVQLVPADDMAFTLTRRPTFHYLNTAPMKFGYIPYWNYIGHLIREDAKINGRLFSINTGAFIINPSEKKGPIKVNIEEIDIKEVDIEEVDVWIKMIRYEEKELTSASSSEEKGTGEMKSFAIVMNTGLDEARFKTFNEELCKDNLCDQASTMYKLFGLAPGSVRCCSTKLIAEKYFDKKFGTEASFTIDGFTIPEESSPEMELIRFMYNLYIPRLE